jgi:hypothetical protein
MDDVGEIKPLSEGNKAEHVLFVSLVAWFVMSSNADSNPGQQAVIFTALAACEKKQTNRQTNT